MAARLPLPKRRRLVSIPDPGDDDATWVFDLDWLESSYTCVFGQGCQGIRPERGATRMDGCCIHGAHFVDADDEEKVRPFVDRLTPEQWQFHGRAKRGGWAKSDGTNRVTRVIDDVCIFSNRPGFAGGVGCALHHGALAAGERPLDWKPQVCWQVPFRIDYHTDEYGHRTNIFREWRRRDWGPGGDDFGWWCTESSRAYVGAEPVWRGFADEIAELVGDDVYRALVRALSTA
jgi:hypothetical protein